MTISIGDAIGDGAMCFVWQGAGDAADSNTVVSPHYVLIALATRILNAHVSV
jgi:hypothetical protein